MSTKKPMSWTTLNTVSGIIELTPNKTTMFPNWESHKVDSRPGHPSGRTVCFMQKSVSEQLSIRVRSKSTEEAGVLGLVRWLKGLLCESVKDVLPDNLWQSSHMQGDVGSLPF